MTESEKYAGFKWIKVPRAAAQEFDGGRFVPEEHHIAETTFLIQTVRDLAGKIDELNAALEKGSRSDDASLRPVP